MSKFERRQRAGELLVKILKDPVEASKACIRNMNRSSTRSRGKSHKYLKTHFYQLANASIRFCLEVRWNEEVPPATTPAEAARNALRPIADQFDDYDAVIFPIQYGANATEANRVDIIRISPPDARHLINERKDPRNRRKLAGTAVFSFGAFLARFSRENDMLWGRLDAAEVLIRSLLRDTQAANETGLVDGLVEESAKEDSERDADASAA